jgi:GNAT superfamily N-acetyltransferase
VTLSTERLTSLDEKTKTWLFDLLRTNMKKHYEASEWGWDEKYKTEEMFVESAWYLFARTKDGNPVGFAHFRYDMDFDDEVLYVYEIQIEDSYRRKGLGRFMMQVLELLAFKADMRKIMLTAFKHNPDAKRFFKETMKFEIDETCPLDDVYEQFDYEILSKFNKRKLAREAVEEEVNGTTDGGT